MQGSISEKATGLTDDEKDVLRQIHDGGEAGVALGELFIRRGEPIESTINRLAGLGLVKREATKEDRWDAEERAEYKRSLPPTIFPRNRQISTAIRPTGNYVLTPTGRAVFSELRKERSKRRKAFLLSALSAIVISLLVAYLVWKFGWVH